jgi:hypothetical protein
MAILVSSTDRRSALEFAAARPVEGFDPGFVERFKADWSAMQNFANSDAAGRHRDDIHSEFVRAFYEQSGVALPMWFRSTEEGVARELEATARGQFDQWKAKNPNSDLTFPDPDAVTEQVIERAGAARARSASAADRSSSWASAVGGFAGTAAGALTDPINMAAMAFGAPRAAGILRTALFEGGVNMVSEAAIQVATSDFKREVDPEFSTGDAAREIAAAGAGGAVLSAGLKGIAAAWHRAATGEWPRHVRDAANVVSREASVPKSRLDRSANGEAVYRAAIEKAADDIVKGRPVEIPQDAFLPANARPGRVYDAEGRSVGVTYEVVEADSLVTSHGDDMSPNPLFPPELQPRDRTRAISQDQVQSIAGNLQPERLGPSPQAESGAPIVGPDGLVESGNARVMALRRAYQAGGVPAENYRAFLRAQNFDISGMQNPVLVARRVTDLDDEARVGFVTAANRSTALRLGASEQALADARLIDDAVLARLEGVDSSALENRDFVRGFMAKLPRAEQGELVDRHGVLSQGGERRVMAALMGRAYGEPALLGRALEDADSNIKSIAGAMGDAAGPWAKMRDAVARGDIPRGMDITDDLLEAVRLVTKARDEGRSVKDMVNQAEMFGGPNEIAKLVARAMFSDDDLKRPVGRAKLTAFLNDYAAEAMKNDAGPRLFGDPLGAPDVLRSSLARVGRTDLEAVAAERLTPERMDEIAEADDTLDAVIMEAERMRAASHGARKPPRPASLTYQELAIVDDVERLAILRDERIAYALAEQIVGVQRGVKGAVRRAAYEVLPFVQQTKPDRSSEAIAKGTALVRSVREKLGIPNAETDPIAFERWRSRYERREKPIMVDLGDGTGPRSLDEIFDEADDEISAAAEIEACALGRMKVAASSPTME